METKVVLGKPSKSFSSIAIGAMERTILPEGFLQMTFTKRIADVGRLNLLALKCRDHTGDRGSCQCVSLWYGEGGLLLTLSIVPRQFPISRLRSPTLMGISGGF